MARTHSSIREPLLCRRDSRFQTGNSRDVGFSAATSHTHPEGCWLPRQPFAEIAAEVVAVALQQVVGVALVLLPELLHHLLHLLGRQVSLPNLDALPVQDCRQA